MIRVFLDANVIFSAAWSETAGINVIWKRPDFTLVTSGYAVAEARRNIQNKKTESINRVNTLIDELEVFNGLVESNITDGLPEKDAPILATSIATNCHVLVTGDITHFGHLIGTSVDGVEVLTPSMLLSRRSG